MPSTLQDVELTEIIVFSAALVLTGLLGTGFVRLSLRPLRRVAATATRVTELPLASGQVTLPDRVPDANPRTEVGQVGAAFNRMLGHVEAALARRASSEPGCAASPPTPATSCAPRWPPSAATPNWRCATPARSPARSSTRCAGSNPNRRG